MIKTLISSKYGKYLFLFLLILDIAQWQYTDWSECSKTCGNGTMIRNVTCVQFTDKECDENKKESLVKFCNTQDCQSSWRTEEWSECNCGKPGVQMRFVEKSESVSDDKSFQKCRMLSCWRTY